jgi:hypothetical protein
MKSSMNWEVGGQRFQTKVIYPRTAALAVFSSDTILAATDSFSALADSVANSLGSTDPIWFVFWVKLNLIFLGTFVASAITGMRGKGKGIGVVEQLEGEQRLTQGARGDKEKGEFLIEL